MPEHMPEQMDAQPMNRTAFRPRAIVALLLLCGLGPLAHAAAPAVMRRGVDEVEARNARVLDHWDGAQVTGVRALGGKSASVIEVLTAQNRRFVVRRPRRGVDHAMRVGVSQQKLAAQLGDARLVVPSAKSVAGPNLAAHIPVGTEVMVVKHVGEKYMSASVAPPQWVAKIPEKQRLISAIVDLLHEHRDRKTENVMVREDGTTRLIDPDKCCGEGKDNRAFRSQFFPGGKIAYATPQNRFADLPPEMQEVVGAIAAMDLPSIATSYGLTAPEAQLLSTHAKRIVQVSLTATINEYVRTLGQLHADK